MGFFSAVLRSPQDDLDLTIPVLSLVAANAVTIVFAIAGNWDAGTVLFAYWTQSVSIGVATVITILRSDPVPFGKMRGDPATARFTLPGPAMAWISRLLIAGFFTLHYGLFHFVYLIFIASGIFGRIDLVNPGIWLSCLLFFVNHLFSLVYYGKREGTAGDLRKTISATYLRIFPMHLALIGGMFLIAGLGVMGISTTLPPLIILLVIKTALDIRSHMRRHAAAGAGGTGKQGA